MLLPPLFVGREREQQHYQELLGRESPWVLVITGQGGNGKSTLLRRLREQTPKNTPVVLLDFASDALCVDALAVLERVADQLESYCNKQSSLAFKQALQQGREELSANKHMNETIIAREDAMVQGNQLTMSAAINEQHRQVRELVRMALFTLVDTLRPMGLVIMLDTCERLYEAERLVMSEVGSWIMNDLIPALHTHLQRKRRHCFAVVASRMPLSLEAINEQEREHVVLPMLDESAVNEYLQPVGMDMALRKRVYDLTHGHALCVAIIRTLWQERGEQPFTLADLPTLQEHFTERALLKLVGERILDKRLKKPFRELTRYGTLLRSFNLPMLQAVFPELQLQLDQFRQLINYPYVESLHNGRYVFHDLLREIQAKEIREQEPNKWRDYHQSALEHLTQSTPQSPDRYYHAIAYDEEQGISEWWDAVTELHNYDVDDLSALLQAAHDVTLKLSLISQAQRAFLQGRFHYFRYGSQLEAAQDLYEQALGLFRQVGDRLGEANVRKALGDVQQFRKEMPAALESYEQALGLFRQVGSKLGEANCYLAQGRVALAQENYQEALALHTDAYRLYQHIQDGYSQARLLYYRSLVYEAMNEQKLAIADIESALPIAQALNLPFVDLLQQRLGELRGDTH